MSNESLALAHKRFQIDLLLGFGIATGLATMAVSMVRDSINVYISVAILAVLLLNGTKHRSGFWKLPFGCAIFLIGTNGVVASFDPVLESAPLTFVVMNILLIALSLSSVHNALRLCATQVTDAQQGA
jgi:hypothetical protein